jgi:hypothetical protein
MPPWDATLMTWREQVVFPPPQERVQGVQPPGRLTTQSDGHGAPAEQGAACVNEGHALPPWSKGTSRARERLRECCALSPHEAGQLLQLPQSPAVQSCGHGLLVQKSCADNPAESGQGFPPCLG